MITRTRLLWTLPVWVAIAGCTQHHGSDDEGEGSAVRALVAVRTAPVVLGDMETVIRATGSTDAVRKEKIVAPIAGVVLSLRVLEGTPVRKGDVVAVLQPKETRAAIAGAEALERAARTEGEREEAARAKQLAFASQNNLEVRTPTAGIVSTRSVTEGEIVGENAEMMTVVDLSTLIFVADIPLQDVAQVRPGQRAYLVFPSLPGEIFGASVDGVNPRSDPGSQTVRVRLAFTGADGKRKMLLRSDMSGLAGIVTGKHSGVLIVPKTALLRNDETDRYTVVMATDDSLARVVSVSVGARTDSTVEISGSGIVPGARIVVEGNYALEDSTRIAPAE